MLHRIFSISFTGFTVSQNIRAFRWNIPLNKGDFFKKERGLEISPCFIFCIVFEEKYLLRYVLLPDHILMPECLYLLRYWAICVF